MNSIPDSSMLSTSLRTHSRAELDLLRKEDARLERQISNLSLIRLIVMIVVTFLFASATVHRNNNAIEGTISKILAILQARNEKLNNSLDPLTLYLKNPTWSNPDADLVALTDTLKAQYSQRLTVKLSAIGTDVSFDLRLLILTSPLWVAFGTLYMAILREKRRMIRVIVYTINQRLTSGHIPILDRLVFGSREGAYRSYPTVLVERAFWVIAIALLGFMVRITLFATSDEADSVFEALIVLTYVFSFWFYLQMSISFVLRRFQRQIEEELACLVPPDRFRLFWSQLTLWLYDLPRRIKPRLTLRTGALLILFTLVLPTAEVGCNHGDAPRPKLFGISQSAKIIRSNSAEGEIRPGYQLLNGHADWPVALLATKSVLRRIYYGALMTLAAAGLLLSFFKPCGATAYRRLATYLSILSFAASIFVLSDFGILLPLGVIMLGPSKTADYVVELQSVITALTLLLLTRPLRRRSFNVEAKFHYALQLFYTPLVLADVLYIGFRTRDLPGLAFLYFGVHLVTLSLLGLVHQSRRLVDPRESPAATTLTPTEA